MNALAEAPFSGREIAGFCEPAMLVTHKQEGVATLERQLWIHVCDGDVDDPRRLAFAGERGRTLILCLPGRGWLPTDRAAEMHPVELLVRGERSGQTTLSNMHRVAGRTVP